MLWVEHRLFVYIFEFLRGFESLLTCRFLKKLLSFIKADNCQGCLQGEDFCFDFLFLYVRPHKLLWDEPHSSAKLLARPIRKGRASSNSFELCGVLARANYKNLTKICNIDQNRLAILLMNINIKKT